MEVYSAIYNNDLQTLDEIKNVIVDEHFYTDFLSNVPIVFSGNAVEKVQPVLAENSHAIFATTKTSARYLLELAHEKYCKNDFADVAYFEPFYLKEFQAGGGAKRP
jgi:tRNA threonylcarbamoyladenosine biosynthesis protein TsaB